MNQRQAQQPLRIINSVAPIRICDNGGWTDTWFAEHGKIFNIGVYPYAEVQIEVFPDIELDRVTVTMAYPGAGPEEVEEGIVQPIEEAVQGIQGGDRIVSTANEGRAQVSIEVLDGFDVREHPREARARLGGLIEVPGFHGEMDGATNLRLVEEGRAANHLFLATAASGVTPDRG